MTCKFWIWEIEHIQHGNYNAKKNADLFIMQSGSCAFPLSSEVGPLYQLNQFLGSPHYSSPSRLQKCNEIDEMAPSTYIYIYMKIKVDTDN